MISFNKTTILALFLFSQVLFSQNSIDSTSYYYQKGDYNKGIIHGEKIKNHFEFEKKDKTSDYNLLLNNLAISYLEINEYSKAASLFLKELELEISLFGENNRILRNVYYNLGNVYFNLKNYKNSEVYYLKAISSVRTNLGENHPDYSKFLLDLALLYKDTKKLYEAESLYLEAIQNIKINSGENNIDYQKVLKAVAIFYDEKGDIVKADELFFQSYNLQKLNLKKETFFDFIFTLDAIGKRYNNQQKHSEAKKFYLESLELKGKVLGNQSQEYIKSLIDLGMSFSQQSDYPKSRKYFDEAKAIFKNLKKENSQENSFVLKALASGYRFEGKYDLSERLYYQVLDIYKNNHEENRKAYIESLKLLAGNYLDKGDLNNAEKYYLKSIDLIVDKNSYNYIDCLIEVGNFYLALNNSQKALIFLNQINDKFIKFDFKADEILNNLDDKKEDYLKKREYLTLNIKKSNLWLQYYCSIKDYKNALPIAINNVETTKKDPLFGILSGAYSKDLSDLALVYKYLGDYQNSERFYLQAYKIRKNNIGQNPRNDAALLLNLALIYQHNKDFINAEKYFLQSVKMVEERLSTTMPYYDDLLYYIGTFYYNNSEPSKAIPYLNKIFIKNNSDINAAISFLSVNEFQNIRKEQDDKRNFPLSFLQKYRTQYPEINIGCYENTLIVKNLSLRNQQRIKTSIEKSGDATLQEKYRLFIENKRYLSKLEELTVDKRPTSYEQLITTTETLEKELVRQSTAFADAKKSLAVNWKQIQENLKPNEIAIDLVAYNYYNKKWTDSIVYAAFVVKKGFKAPKYIPLFEQKQLEFLLAKNKNEKSSNRIDKQYSEKSISDLFLKPMAKELVNVTSIYLSPAGLGHQIDFSALPVSEAQTLGEKYKVHVLGSTAEILNYKVAHLDPKTNLELILYGNIDYDKSGATNKVVSDTLTNTNSELVALITRSSATNKYKYLKGSKIEINKINTLAHQNNFASTIIDDKKATEESIKLLDGRTTPFVLHLATHGFFFPDLAKEMPKETSRPEATEKSYYKIAEDPMMRSGLIMAGANKISQKTYEGSTIDDGILTANEISNLDLSACQLVVLSACETGLGEINGSEGVYGLQRAFKMAGVKNIIMSLWKVPDAQTAELFDVFYTECFAGKSIHEAFQTAQAKMKVKYSPYYWAGFVLLE